MYWLKKLLRAGWRKEERRNKKREASYGSPDPSVGSPDPLTAFIASTVFILSFYFHP
jgi:hypothetical protein